MSTFGRLGLLDLGALEACMRTDVGKPTSQRGR